MESNELNKSMASAKSEALVQLFIYKLNSELSHNIDSNFNVSSFYTNSKFMEKLNSNNEHFKTLLVNCIAKSEFKNFYTCYDCNFEIPCHRIDIIDLHLRVNPSHNTKNQILDETNQDELFLPEEDMCKKLVENSIVLKKSAYFCNFCKEHINDFIAVQSHLNKHKHKSQLSVNTNNSAKLCSEDTLIKKNIQESNFCEKLLPVQKTTELSNAQKNECIQNFFKNFKDKLNDRSKKNSDNSKVKEVINNITTETHSARKELIKLIENLESLNSPESSDADVVPTSLFKVNKKQKKPLLKYSREKKSRISTIKTEKNYFRRYSLFHDKNYIEHCIETGERNIYNVSQEKMCLMKLGVTLTFPYLSEQICIPCGHQFSDGNQFLFNHLQSQEHIKNLTSFIAHDKEFEDYPDQFSDLKLANWYMQEESDDLVHCYACNIKVKNNNSEILLHTETLDHISQSENWKNRSDIISQEFSMIFSKIWYYAQRFFCEICKLKFYNEIDFTIHLGKPPHIEKVKRLKQSGSKLNFNFCYTCATYWYGKSDYYDKHCKDDFHKIFLKNRDFMIPEMSLFASDYLAEANSKIDSQVNESNKVQLEKIKEFFLLKDIEEAVNSKFLKAKAYAFGSRISLLGLPHSIVDIFLDCNNEYCKSASKKDSKEYFVTTKELIENFTNVWSLKECVQDCRAPVLKLKHIPTNLRCNISFMNGLGVEKSSLIGYENYKLFTIFSI